MRNQSYTLQFNCGEWMKIVGFKWRIERWIKSIVKSSPQRLLHQSFIIYFLQNSFNPMKGLIVYHGNKDFEEIGLYIYIHIYTRYEIPCNSIVENEWKLLVLYEELRVDKIYCEIITPTASTSKFHYLLSSQELQPNERAYSLSWK